MLDWAHESQNVITRLHFNNEVKEREALMITTITLYECIPKARDLVSLSNSDKGKMTVNVGQTVLTE